MKHLLRLLMLTLLLCLPTLPAYAQKRRVMSRKETPASGQTFCAGDKIPSGYVIVGYEASNQCGTKSELRIKKPAALEIVCNSSPLPTGYRIVRDESSIACQSRETNLLNNALEIARDDIDVPATPKAQLLDSRRPVRNTTYDAEEVRNERAAAIQEEAQQQVKILNAIRDHKIVLGMTRDEVVKSWGRPYSISRRKSSISGYIESWTYRTNRADVYIKFKNGVVDYFSADF